MIDDQDPHGEDESPEDEEDRTLAKLEALLLTHQRFVTDFQKSLEQAGNFIALAGKTLETEPEKARELLLQVQRVGLLGNLRQLKDDFDWMVAFGRQTGLAEDADWRVALEELAVTYGELLETSQAQDEEMDDLLSRFTAQ